MQGKYWYFLQSNSYLWSCHFCIIIQAILSGLGCQCFLAKRAPCVTQKGSEQHLVAAPRLLLTHSSAAQPSLRLPTVQACSSVPLLPALHSPRSEQCCLLVLVYTATVSNVLILASNISTFMSLFTFNSSYGG